MTPCVARHRRVNDCSLSEDSFRDLSDGGGSSSSGHRRQGEGKSCGGGRSSICFGNRGEGSNASALRNKSATHANSPVEPCKAVTPGCASKTVTPGSAMSL